MDLDRQRMYKEQYLKKLYEAIREALNKDDSLPVGHKEYGVREFPDWRQQASEIEKELRENDILFEPIKW